MRICILTQPLGANYGGILQAYALQNVLRDMGHEVTTLRFRPDVPWVPSGYRKHVLTLRRFISKYLKGNKDIVCCNPDRQTRFAYRELDHFIDTRMHCLEVKAPLSLHKLPDFDTFIVGSDQVWRPAYSPCLPNFYLDFLADSPARRIAYAASFGVDTWEADEEMTSIIRPLAQKFDVISVREESGIALCEKYLNVKAQVMPDPTLLLSATDYLQLCEIDRKNQKPYLAVYILDKGEQEQHFIDGMSKAMNLPVKFIGQLDWAQKTDSVEKWLADIAQASFVITNSFHGTVFSILFERNFLSIINSGRGTTRFTSLLEPMGLKDRLLDRNALDGYTTKLGNIDYTAVNKALAIMRKKGIDFLSFN